ncbi:ankyrin repeat-containing domain protein [Haematococcus lacustris]
MSRNAVARSLELMVKDAMPPSDCDVASNRDAEPFSVELSSQLQRLMQAIKRGDLASLAAVLAAAPEVSAGRSSALSAEHAFNGGWWTPLGLASRLGHADVCRLLLSKGVDQERACAGFTGQDPRRADACEFGSRYRPLHLAAMGRHARTLQALLEGGADPAATDGSGCTALYVAARQLSPECVQVLLEAGSGGTAVGVDAVNEEEETPMMAALVAWHTARSLSAIPRVQRTAATASCLIIARLLEAGAKPNDRVAINPATGLEVGYSSALLTALDCGMDDLAALLHLHGAKLPPAEPRRPARPESALF